MGLTITTSTCALEVLEPSRCRAAVLGVQDDQTQVGVFGGGRLDVGLHPRRHGRQTGQADANGLLSAGLPAATR